MEFKTLENLTALQAQNLIVAQYVESYLKVTDTYPDSPNGSALGIIAISNIDGPYCLDDATSRTCIPCCEQFIVPRRLV
ncbi:MAG: phosphoribosylformylglycinamidine synthase subunit PurQ [Haemophilus parainfluenzae]|jgi:phosphoribosylformylglycinamidine synthase|nr:phosphoribosylformylglycinamidine synthase subunit PurQ [uncultured Haemophilus sp.]MBS5085048.1 phosphoribosylformylglycinamidine synthase subunit PurQ [Haemophilus parainfluenzae]MDU2039460.1 phosphoribosylformylglycinamidine synthase subunit PurQ [Haemophilus parainfluenzae]MDU6288874.1 phosphoribosylformylglycinamidine synthase subunit PurQ [Haemophilus parainfluenzae]